MTHQVGISGLAVYVPPYRVDLQSWCEWTGTPWDKTRAVVGNSFRMRGPAQSVYTMAATAVMRLITGSIAMVRSVSGSGSMP